MKNSSHIGAEPSPTPAGADGATQPPAPRIAPAASAPREWPAFQVERRPFADLRRDPRNARVHSSEQVRQIALSMREWGWTTALLVDETGLIIAGHGRLDAAELNRAELPGDARWQAAEAPVIVARGWTAAQKRAYALADNQIALNASWNDDLLRFELGELGTLELRPSG
jgi:ParB-like chromosome segregation protein Spo0J